MDTETRPRTVRDLLAQLRARGIDRIGARLDVHRTSHSAPLGIATDWDNPTELRAIVGGISGRVSSSRSGYRWGDLWWFHSGTGGSGGDGFRYEFVVWADDVPEVWAEWQEACRSCVEAEKAHAEFVGVIEAEIEAACAEIRGRRAARLEELHEKIVEARGAYAAWLKLR